MPKKTIRVKSKFILIRARSESWQIEPRAGESGYFPPLAPLPRLSYKYLREGTRHRSSTTCRGFFLNYIVKKVTK